MFRRMRGPALVRWLEDLSKGDPVAVGLLIGFGVFLAIFGVIFLKVHRDLKREDDTRARKNSRR